MQRARHNGFLLEVYPEGVRWKYYIHDFDHPEAPPSFQFLPVGKYTAKVSIESATNTMLYRRVFVFGGEKLPQFPAGQYKALKAIFDQVHSSDEHMITLKLADTPPAATGATQQ